MLYLHAQKSMRVSQGGGSLGLFLVFFSHNLTGLFVYHCLLLLPPPWGARAKSAGLFFADSAERFVTATNRNCSGGVTNRSGS